jgi:chromosome segregation ATPase
VEGEIASLREQAEARMRSLQADIAAISDERRTLLEEVHRIAARLEEVVAEAAPEEEEPPPERPETLEPARAGKTDAMPPAWPIGGESQDERPQAGAPAPEA